MKILIANDDERILRLLSNFLKSNNYEVITATNGEESLDYFKNKKDGVEFSITLNC